MAEERPVVLLLAKVQQDVEALDKVMVEETCLKYLCGGFQQSTDSSSNIMIFDIESK